MIGKRIESVVAAGVAAIALGGCLTSAVGASAALPVKLLLSSQFGRQVNLTETEKAGGPALEDVCTVVSKDECQPGLLSELAGGLSSSYSVAASPNGNLYVAEYQNLRVQEFTPAGEFVLMFGKEVNETTKGNLCTAEEVAKSAVVCKAGAGGGEPGQLNGPNSVAVDPSGDVYVTETIGGSGKRVQKFTATGSFLLEIGKEVNETTKENLCTVEDQKKGDVCTAPAQQATPEPATFNFELEAGNLLAVGPAGELYVGDEGRVQEFAADGKFSREIQTTTGMSVYALAVDQARDLFFVLASNGTPNSVVHELNDNGEPVGSFTDAAEAVGAVVAIRGMAMDPEGRLAIVAEQALGAQRTRFGTLYEPNAGSLISRFTIPTEHISPRDSERVVQGVGFGASGGLYVTTGLNGEILVFQPKDIAKLTTGAASCGPGGTHATDVVVDCTLNGEVDPEGVAETEAWFEFGTTPEFGESTAKNAVAVAGPASAIVGVPPNATIYYRLAAEDHNIKAPEGLNGESLPVASEYVAPVIAGPPSTPAVATSSALMFGELNPENAGTEYFFEFSAGEEALSKCAAGVRRTVGGCPAVAVTRVAQSSVYGAIGATFEATSLQPGTHYSYRLFAESEGAEHNRLASVGPIAGFTTEPAPAPGVRTEEPSAVTSTSAVMSGMVEPDGASVTYSFELGVYAGAETQYGVVASGVAGPGGGPVEVSAALSGLQPGTAYAYRLSIKSGYIAGETHSQQGALKMFTTAGLPSALQPPSPLAHLPVPDLPFAKEEKGGGKPPSRSEKLAKALKACHKKRDKGKRVSCEKQAHKMYGVKKGKKK